MTAFVRDPNFSSVLWVSHHREYLPSRAYLSINNNCRADSVTQSMFLVSRLEVRLSSLRAQSVQNRSLSPPSLSSPLCFHVLWLHWNELYVPDWIYISIKGLEDNSLKKKKKKRITNRLGSSVEVKQWTFSRWDDTLKF